MDSREVRSVSSANSQTSNDIGSDTADRRMESAEKRFERLKEQIQQRSSTVMSQEASQVPPRTTMKNRLKSIFTIRKKAAIQPIMEPRNTKKTTIKDKDCGSMRDFISHERIPKKYAIYIDKQCYDARNLLQWLSHDRNMRLPHTNVTVTPEQYQRIKKKAIVHHNFKINEIHPRTYEFEKHSIMNKPAISKDGRFIAFDNSYEKVEIWDLHNKKQVNELDLFTNGEIFWMEWSEDGTQVKALVKSRYSNRLRVQWKIWDTKTWKLNYSVNYISHEWETGLPINYIVDHANGIDYLAVITNKKERRSIDHRIMKETNGIEIWDLTHDEKIMQKTFARPETIYSVSLRQGKLAINMGSSVIVMDITSNEPPKVVLTNVQNILWNCNGSLLAILEPTFEPQTGIEKTMVTILKPFTSQKIVQYKTSHQPSLSWHPNKENIIAISHYDSQRFIDIVDTASKTIQRITVGTAQGNPWSNQLQWTKHGQQIVSTYRSEGLFGRNFMVYRWDVYSSTGGMTTKEVHVYNGRQYKVHTGKQGGKYILVGKEKKKVYIDVSAKK
jgi:hypothetical protein